MKVKETQKVYVADDGKEFATREECKAYEDKDVFKPLLKMTEAQLGAVISGEDEVRGKLMARILRRHNDALREKGVKAPKVKRTKEEREELRIAKAKEVLAAADAEA